MPKITKEFIHDSLTTTCGSMYPIKTRTNNALDVMYTHKEATDAFYSDFKELFAQCTALNPVFNDEEKSFVIFDAKFYVRCINTVNAPNYSNATKEYCVRPFLFKEGFEYHNPPVDLSERTDATGNPELTYNKLNCSRDNNAQFNQIHYDDNFIQGNIRNFNGIIFFYHSRYTGNMSANRYNGTYDNANGSYYSGNSMYYGYTYPGSQYARYGYDSSATIIPYNDAARAHYTIEIYYNSNWVQILYKSNNGEKFSLGLFFVGQFTNPSTKETEDLLFTQQEGASITGFRTVMGNGMYMSNFLYTGLSKWGFYNGSNQYASEKVRYSNLTQSDKDSSDYFASQVTNQQLMIFKKGHLTNILEELDKQNIFYADNANAVLNTNVSVEPKDNDFQLYNYGLKDVLIPISQLSFGYVVPLDKKFYKIPATALNGMVKFENIIYGQAQAVSGAPIYQSFDSDMVYDIDDESYYCPFSVYRNIYSYNKHVDILLKL